MNSISIEEVKAIYIPFWIVPFKSHTEYYGVERGSVTRYRTRTRTVRDSDGKTRTETYQEAYQVTVYRPVESQFDRTGRHSILARKHAVFYGFYEFVSTLSLENLVDFDFELTRKDNCEFINAEIEEHESQMQTYGDIENQNRSKAGSGLHRLVRCDSDVDVGEPLYVHAPLWLVRYSYNDKNYKVAIAGDSGNVLKGEIPISTKKRIINYVVAIAMLLAGAVLGNFGLPLLENEASQVWGIIMLIIAIVGIGLTALPIRMAMKMQLEKSSLKNARRVKRKGRNA
ncbi:MAG: hypothetical protein EU530_08215 [Promethearchaeota archaeon]|nr:MAG: hypothetical protein EU530_08215 [Candidatus Lokiarchaeota archaeon]